MTKFICTAEKKPAVNFKGEVIGTTPKRAIFKSADTANSKLYRSDLQNPGKGLKLFKVSEKEEAQRVCDKFNEAYNDDFKVETATT